MPTLGRDLVRAAFASPVRTTDNAGGSVLTWSDEFTVDAGFQAENARELARAGTLTDSEIATLIVRESSDALTIGTDWSVTVRGKRWNVRGVARMTGAAPHRLRLVIETGASIVA